MATQFGRYGYRRITELLRWDGWLVNHKRVERLWRQEALKVPKKQPKRRRLWLNDGSCVRLRPVRKNHVWSYDFVSGRTSDGKPLRFLNILDEFSRVCLSIDVDRHLTSEEDLNAGNTRSLKNGDTLAITGHTLNVTKTQPAPVTAARRRDLGGHFMRVCLLAVLLILTGCVPDAGPETPVKGGSLTLEEKALPPGAPMLHDVTKYVAYFVLGQYPEKADNDDA